MEEFKTKHSRITSTRYLERFFSLNSAEELIKYKLFPNPKEITESFGMLNAVETVIHNSDPYISKDNENITCIVVGDGQKPRTGALCAFLTKWNVYSIDPDMKWLNVANEITRLTCMAQKIEDAKLKLEVPGPVIIMMPHAHASAQASWDCIQSPKKWLVRMRCCTKDEINVPGISYNDPHVCSPKNKIEIHSNYLAPRLAPYGK